MATYPTALAAAFREAESLVAAHDRDRWLAGLFAPADRRPALMALAAFSLEVSRIRETVRDPMPGEIRLQWWADALTGGGHGDVGRHPVAAALLDTVTRYRLPAASLAGLVEARRFDLYDDPMPTLLDLEGYAGETVSILLQAGALVLTDGDDPQSADAAGHGGVAYALAGLMRALPIHAARGQCFLPVDLLARHGTDPATVRAREKPEALRSALAEMRSHAEHHLTRAETALARVDGRARLAFVGLGLIRPWLAGLARVRDPYRDLAEMAAWRRPLALWRYRRKLRWL